jgi:hypothetical protein
MGKLATDRFRPIIRPMERHRGEQEDFGQAELGEAQSDNPPDDAEMIEPDADPLDTDVEDADLFLGLEDDDGYADDEEF